MAIELKQVGGCYVVNWVQVAWQAGGAVICASGFSSGVKHTVGVLASALVVIVGKFGLCVGLH